MVTKKFSLSLSFLNSKPSLQKSVIFSFQSNQPTFYQLSVSSLFPRLHAPTFQHLLHFPIPLTISTSLPLNFPTLFQCLQNYSHSLCHSLISFLISLSNKKSLPMDRPPTKRRTTISHPKSSMKSTLIQRSSCHATISTYDSLPSTQNEPISQNPNNPIQTSKPCSSHISN